MVKFYSALPKFEYTSPQSVQEALDLVNDKKHDGVRLYAGGTDVLPKLKKRLIDVPRMLIDLKRISELDYVKYDLEKGLRIGALATLRCISTSPIVRERFEILSQAADSIAARQIQNRGTLVGNICSGVPSADSAPALLCLDAKIICMSTKGERSIPIREFFVGPHRTIIRNEEIVKEIQIPEMPPGSRGVYIKLSTRKRMDLAIVGVAVVLVSDNRICKEIKIGLGAVAPTAIRAERSEARLLGQELSGSIIEQVAQRAAEESSPIDDHRATAWYRRCMVRVLVKRAVHQIIAK